MGLRMRRKGLQTVSGTGEGLGPDRGEMDKERHWELRLRRSLSTTNRQLELELLTVSPASCGDARNP